MTKHDFAKQFSRWLRSRTGLRHGFSNHRLARCIGVDPSAVTFWRAGVYPETHKSAGVACLPTRDNAIAIAKALGEPVDRVLLLAGHAPEADPEEAYRKLHPDPMAERKLVAL